MPEKSEKVGCGSIVIRLAALGVVILCFTVALTDSNPKASEGLLIGGFIFVILLLGTFVPSHCVAFPLGAFFIGYAAIGISTGSIKLGRYGVTHYLSRDPTAFWNDVALCVVIGLVTMWYGHREFGKDRIAKQKMVQEGSEDQLKD